MENGSEKVISKGEFLIFGLLYVTCAILIGFYGGYVVSEYFLQHWLWKFVFLVAGLTVLILNFYLYGGKYLRLLRSLD